MASPLSWTRFLQRFLSTAGVFGSPTDAAEAAVHLPLTRAHVGVAAFAIGSIGTAMRTAEKSEPCGIRRAPRSTLGTAADGQP